jgi:N-methylhydantoinase A
MRYVGQASEIVVPLPSGPYGACSRAALLQAFESSYLAAFGRTPPSRRIEIINVRVSLQAPIAGDARPPPAAPPAAARAVKGSRPVYLPQWREFRATPVYDRYALAPGQACDGPAIIEERESTLVVGGGRFEVLASGSIIVSIA